MTKKKIIIVGIIVVSLSIWGIVKYFSKSNALPATTTWVQASNVKESTLPLEVQSIGTLTANSAEITPELPGHVHEIHFKDGTFVKKGTVLIQLDDDVYKTKYELAKAKLGFSETNFKRMKLLGTKGAVAQQAIDQAEAELKERKADADDSKVMVDKMKLVAPFDGVMGKGKISLGDYVATAQNIVTITNTKQLRVEYNVPEQYYPLLKLDQTVKIKSSTYPNQTFVGKVAFISPTINIDNRSVSIYAEVPNEENKLASGMFVNVTHELGNEERVLLVPSRSLVPILEGEQVFKVVDGKAYSVNVTLGKRTEDQVQILQGVSKDDVIITDGQHKVKDGMPVKIKT